MTPHRPHRTGPRPLPLHLTAALAAWQSSLIAWQLWKAGWPIWKPGFTTPAADIKNCDAADFLPALTAEITARYQKLLRGIACYQQHPYTRAVPTSPIVWQQGTTKVYSYADSGTPILIIPSLVNRYYVMDLEAEHSFVRWLTGQGYRPFVVDWDAPSDAERDYHLNDYIQQRLVPLLNDIKNTTGEAPVILGYCMGGLLAAALAVLYPAGCRALVLMATPWDFHAPSMQRLPLEIAENCLARAAVLKTFPVDWQQAFFTAIDPLQAAQKFLRFAGMAMDGDAARKFVALEDWLNDGVDLTVGVARDCFIDWYGHNTPARKQWRVADTVIDPAQITSPALAIIPAQDRIVPPDSAAALSSAIPGCLRLDPPLGHIGMMVSRDAKRLVWEPLARWLKTIG